MENVECFLCTSLDMGNLKISNTLTKYQKLPISQILHAFAGKDHIEIVITNADSICLVCKQLLDELDLMRTKLQNIENIIALKLHRKYQFDDIDRKLPAIRLDNETANLYTCGANNHQFQCIQCSYATDFQDCLLPHRLYHHQCADSTSENAIIDFPCQNCRIILSSKVQFDQHMAKFHAPIATLEHRQIDLDYVNNGDDKIQEKRLKCPKCEKTFQNEQQYVHHMNKGHFNCEKCSQKCRNATTLANHIALRHTEYRCATCNKQLSSRITFNAHQSMHGANQNFICAYCDKGFRSKSLLATHIVIHSKEMNFVCHICGQQFIHQRSHRLHVKWHDNPRPYKCDLCLKAFTHSSHLTVHRRIHTGERPKVCIICDRRFINATKLKAHMAVHTNNYLHSCVICQKGYDKRYKLAKHMLSVHDDNTMILNRPQCQYKLIINPEFQNVQ